MAKFGKYQFFEISWAKISKMEEKTKIPESKSFFLLLKSASKPKIMSIGQFLQELLNFKGENWIYL